MVLFLNRQKRQEAPSQEPQIPIGMIEKMASEGMSESEIISQLQKRGFSPVQIDRGLNQALKNQITGPPKPMKRSNPMIQKPPVPHMHGGEGEAYGRPAYPRPRTQPNPSVEMPSHERSPPIPRHPEHSQSIGRPPERIVGGPMMEEPETMMFSQAPSMSPQEMPMQFPKEEHMAPDEITLEEVIEGIVAERWDDFQERLANFEKRDIQIQSQINDLRKQIEEVHSKLKEKEENIVGKLDEYGDSFTGIEGRITNIEKVFKDFLPQLTENVKTIRKIAQQMETKSA